MANPPKRNIRSRIFRVQSSVPVFCPKCSLLGSINSSGSATNDLWRTRICGAWSLKTWAQKWLRFSSSTGTNRSPKARKSSQRMESHRPPSRNHQPASTSPAPSRRNRRAFYQHWSKPLEELSSSDRAWNSFKTCWRSLHLKFSVWLLTLSAEMNRHGEATFTLDSCSELLQLKRFSSPNISTECSSLDFAFAQLWSRRFSARRSWCQTLPERNPPLVKS